MKRTFTLILSIFILVNFSQSLFPQKVDLVELKKKEEERRKKIKKSKIKTLQITENVLRDYSSGRAKHSAGSSRLYPTLKKAPKDKKKETQQTKKQDPKQTKDYWQKRANDIRAQISSAQELVRKKDDEITQLTGQFHLVSDFYNRTNINNKLEMARKMKADFEKSLAELQRKLDDLYTEAKENYIPPGWLG